MFDVKDYMTTKEAAEMLGYHHVSFVKKITKGIYKAVMFNGRYILERSYVATLPKNIGTGRPPKVEK